jgi:hypothetical protein
MVPRASLAVSTLLALIGPSGQLLSAQEGAVAFRIGPIEVLGQGPSHVEIGVGVFDVFKDVVFTEDEENRSAAARLELRVGRKLYALGPAIGLMANTDGGVFGYGGVYIEVAWGDILITPLVGLGGYAEGDSKDLGGVFQFLASGTLAYASPNGSRLGIRLGHLSNAGIHDDNPGEEDLMLIYSLPLP